MQTFSRLAALALATIAASAAPVSAQPTAAASQGATPGTIIAPGARLETVFGGGSYLAGPV